ncbi:hypothetical protein V5O48_003500 [Marasmius crinis-equi]|uniref:F-box domain-containing protein n=1 Tax=Marasmius crinis-equi TaxID=585013 RepID=A0ABR3FSZ8_9AGAR
MSLNSLPNEILHEIACLTGGDVKFLRLVDKLVNGAVDPVMWDIHPIILDLDRGHLALGMSMLDKLSNSSDEKIRKLEIKSLNPAKERPHHPAPDKPDNTEAVAEACRRLPDILPRALSALKGLKSVRWELARKEPEWIHDAVLESLGPLPTLVDFEITIVNHIGGGREPDAVLPLQPLQHLRNGSLQRLAIKHKSIPDLKRFVSSVATVLLHNPHIVHLELDIKPAYGQRWEQLSFQDLVQDLPSNTIRLRSLLLSGWTIQVTPRTWPHLASLHSLELLSSAEYGALWKSLCSSPPKSIRHVTAGRVCDELLDFLQSVSGLEVLELSSAGGDTLAESDRLARRFYQDVFPRHRSTLRKVTISPSYTGMWTIGLHNVDIFDKCRRLTHLTVGLDPDEIRPGENEQDVVASFIARVVHLPELSVLFLPPVAPKEFFGALRGGGTRRFHATKYIIERTQESLQNVVIYDAPRVHQSLSISATWVIGTRGEDFLPLYNDEGSLRFQRPEVEPEPDDED